LWKYIESLGCLMPVWLTRSIMLGNSLIYYLKLKHCLFLVLIDGIMPQCFFTSCSRWWKYAMTWRIIMKISALLFVRPI
jgi:hypothetical protein